MKSIRMLFDQPARSLIPALLALPMLAPVASAQVPTGPVPLADVPLFSISTVKPNVMFTLDNSGSMAWSFAPMYVSGQAGRNCSTSNSFNALYYNPDNEYFPPVNADGSRYPNASYTAAWRDGFFPGNGTVNLQTQYSNVGNYSIWDTFNTGARGAFYHVYNGTVPLDPTVCYTNATYTLVDMNLATPAQQQNFANWFSYYRNRINAMKTSVGEAFRTVDESFRVGFHTINNPGGTGNNGGFMPVDTFVGTHRSNWYTKFYSQTMGSGTPLRQAQWRIGEYYRTSARPGGGLATDPIQFTCQQNYHILSTDGQWNGAAGGSPSGGTNWDNTLPANPELLTALGQEFGTTFTAGSPWPRPYRENPSTPSNNSLADLAAYYWMNDLRTGMLNNVPTSASNPASWQHMVTFGVAFSERGTIPYPTGITGLRDGTLEWPLPVNDSPSAVDDLWHAALIGHGQYFSVASPRELMTALGRALNEIRSRAGSASGAQFSSADFSAVGSPVAFRTGFVAGEWTGEVAAFNVDTATGSVGSMRHWSAREQLNTLVAGTGWDTQRKIATFKTDIHAAVSFRYGNLSAAQQATLDADPAKAQRVLNYLRGDQSNEDGIGIDREFRRRSFILGDVVSSEPVYTAKPRELYSDAFNPGYSAFVAAKASRRPMVYVGANDGMLHAFDASTGTSDSGKEMWAYIPGMAYQTGLSGLASLSYRFSDPFPFRFAHRFRVDQTPTVRDINFGQTVGGSGSDWRTILVSGMNKGGRGFFAIDVTDPEASSEAAVAAKVLWEFTGEVANDPKMGYSFGEPVIVKTRRFGWVVAVSSGYNNAAGTGHIWLLNPRNGNVLHRFDSGVGSAGIPSGLAHVEAFLQSSRDYTAEQLYGVDLMGNVHRFDVSDGSSAGWTPGGTRIASIGKPITSRPAISLNPYNPSERWVFFGSGRLLDIGDVSSGASQAFYAIRDGGASTPAAPATPITTAQLQLLSLTGTYTPTSGTTGWYMNMPNSAHIMSGAYVDRGVVMWATTSPTNDPCSSGATSATYARDMYNGGNRIVSGTSVPSSTGVVKLQAVAVAVTNPTSSKKRFVLNASKRDGTADGSADVDLSFQLIGGRTGVRFISAQ